MRFQLRRLIVPSWLVAAACSSGSSPDLTSGPGDPDNPGDLGDPGPGRPVTSAEQAATDLGMSIMASDAHGAPRLIRSIVPRAGLHGAPAEAVARDHVAALAPLWVQGAAPMALVHNGTQQLRNGATIVTLSQQVGGVMADRSEVRVLLHADSSLAAVSGTLLPAIAAPVFVSSPSEALAHALAHQFAGLPAPAIISVGPISEAGGWQILEVEATPALDVSSARVRRAIATVDDQQLAVWEVESVGDAAPDPLSETNAPVLSAHDFLVADDSGAIVRDDDLRASDAFVYRAYAETTGNRRPLDSPLASFAPHPTGVPDGSAPGFIPANLVVVEAFNRTLDKWLPDNATTTAGNNAEAFADLDANRVFNAGDVRPEVRAGRTLNYTYNQELEPLATPDQSKAGAVNAFFLVNWMHDWWYDSGFTETTRNGQLDNFGRGGVGNDRLLVTSQAGANTGLRNNADMSTPADGAQPRMRMFLWTAGADSVLTAPSGVVRSDTFGAGPRTFSVTGDLVIGLDATAPVDDGCQPITNVAGKIALLTYAAQCNSQVSVNDARAAGAIGVILADGELDTPRSFGGSATANLPGLVVGKTSGLALKAALANGPVTITLQSTARGAERDGDLDNTVVAHEWGHYLHHRLAVCGASQQCAGMSEGWGDFNALMMMLREGDNRDGVYAMAPYAIADGTPDTAYFGLRRFPYSRDRTKNDLSFRHIADGAALPTTTPGFPGGVNSEVHNTGEIWATMMWEVLNVLADEHGVTIARRRMTDYVVGGLLLSPTNATFTEARDAILVAASALDTDDMLLIAAAFAGRGLGSCAVSPLRTSATNQGPIESGTLAARLVIGAARVTDDGTPSDRDGSLEPGESGTLRVAVANGGVLAAEQVTLTATTPFSGIRFGTPRPLALLPSTSGAELTIPVSVAATVPRTTITFTVHIAAEDTCDRAGVTATRSIVIGGSSLSEARVATLAAPVQPGAVEIHSAPATSLRAFDAGVCIAQELQ